MLHPYITRPRVKAQAMALLGLLVVLVGVMTIVKPVQAATSSNYLNFQARLLTTSGAIVPDGTYNIDFKIYNADSTTGSVGTCTSACLWEETRKNFSSQGVQVINGYFSVNLGSVTAFPAINWDQQLYLTMNIGGTSAGASPTWDGEMQNAGHSISLTALPYSFVSGQLAKTSGANRGTLSFNSLTNNPVLVLPNESGTLCSTGSVCTGYAPSATSGYVQLDPSSAQADASTNSSIFINKSSSGNLLQLQSSSADQFVVGNTGAVTQAGNLTFSQANPVISTSTTNTNLSLRTNGTGTLSLNDLGTANTVQVGNTSGAVNQTINIGTNATSGGTNTVHIGDAATATDAITIGSSSNTGSTFTLESGTGTTNLFNNATNHSINLATGAGVETVAVGSTNSTSGTTINGGTSGIKLTPNGGSNTGVLVKPSNDSTAAFQIQNAGGTTTLLNADTTNSRIGIGASSTYSTLQVKQVAAVSSVTASGNEITDTTRAANSQGDGRAAPDSSYGIWESTTNLITNGGFESNTTGWAAQLNGGGAGSVTIARDTSKAKFGSASLKIVTDGSTGYQGTSRVSAVSVTSGLTYTISSWAYGTPGKTYRLILFDGIHSSTIAVATGTFSGGWQRISASGTASFTATPEVDFDTGSTPQTSTFWSDGVQVEQKAFATPYVETSGGTASRSAATVQTSTSGKLTAAQGWVSERLRMGESRASLPSGTYLNLFDWSLDGTANNRVVVYYLNLSGGVFGINYGAAGTTITDSSSSASFNAGDLETVTAYWTSSQIAISLNGANFVTLANSVGTPSGGGTTAFIDSNFSSAGQGDGDILWTATGTGTLTNTDAANINAFGSADPDLTAFPSAGTANFVWKANSANYQNQLINSLQNASGTALLNIDAADSAVLLPSATSSASALILGGDANLYRSAAQTLKTDASFSVGGSLLEKPTTDSTTAFQVQNSIGTAILGIDTVNGQAVLGTASSLTGKLVFNTSAGANNISIVGPAGNPTGNYTLTIPTITGNANICTDNSVCSGYAAAAGSGAYVQLAPSSAQTDSSTNSSIFINKTGASGNLLTLQNNSTTVASVGNSGNTTFKNSTDSAAAFQIQNTGSTAVLAADTSNLNVNVANLSTTGTISLTGQDGGSILLHTAANSGVSAAMTFSGNEITDVTRATSLQGDGRATPDSSTGIWESTTNLITNGGFESNTAGWTPSANATITRITNDSKFGSAAVKFTATTGGNVGNNRMTMSSIISPSTTYSISFWAKRLSGSGNLNIAVDSWAGPVVSWSNGSNNVWSRVTYTGTSPAGSSSGFSFYPSTANDVFEIDGIQVEQKAIATPYVETNGSTASRSAARVQAPSAVMNTTQGWAAARIRMDWASSGGTGSSFPTLLDWRNDTNNRYSLFWNQSTSKWELDSYNGGTSTNTSLSSSFNNGDYATVIAYWTSSGLGISVNGSNFTTTSGGTRPTITATNFDIGTLAGSTTNGLNGDVLWFTSGSGTLSNTDAANIAKYGNSDPSVSGLNSTATSSSPTFAWDGEGKAYSGTNNSPSLQSGLTIDDVNLYHSANGSLALQGGVNSTTAFQVQNASGTGVLTVDTTNGQVAVGSGAVPANGVLTVGTSSTTTAAGGIYFGTDTDLYRSAAGALKTDGSLTVNNAGNNSIVLKTTGQISTYYASQSALLGYSGSGASLQFGTADGTYDTSLYRTGAGTLLFGSSGSNPTSLQIKTGITQGTTDLFQVQDTSGNAIGGFNSSGNVYIGRASNNTGSLKLYNSGGSGSLTIQSASQGTNNFTVTIPTLAGNANLCVDTSNGNSVCSGYAAAAGSGAYVQLAPASAQADSSATNSSIFINKTNASGTPNLLELQKSASDVFVIGNTGNITASGTYNTNTFNSNTLQFGAGGTATVQSAASQALAVTGHASSTWSLDAGDLTLDATAASANLNLGTGAQAKTIQIGTTAAQGLGTTTQTINVGTLNTTGTTNVNIGTGASATAGTTTLQAKTALVLTSPNFGVNSSGNVTAAGTYNTNSFNSTTLTFSGANPVISASTANTNLTLQANGTGSLILGNTAGAVNGTLSLGNNATSGATNTINIGNASTATDTITIGSNSNTANTVSIDAGTAAASIAIGNSTTAHNISIGSGNGTAVTQTISIGNGTSTTSGGVVLNLGNGTPGTGTTNQINIGSGGSTTGTEAITIGSATAANHTLTLQGGNGTIAGTGAAIKIQAQAAGDILVGAAAATGQIVVGSSSSANNVLIANGSGASAVSIANVQNGGSVSLGTGFTTGTFSLGGTATTGAITIGQTTTGTTATVNISSANATASTQTINIGGGTSTTSGGKVVNIATGTPGASTTNTVHIGDGGSTTGTVAVTIGSNALAGHTTLIQGGNGATAIQLQSSGTIGIANNNVAQTVNIGNGTGATAVSVLCGTGTCAFGNNATDHSTTIGSTNGVSTTTIYAGTGSIIMNANTYVGAGYKFTADGQAVFVDNVNSTTAFQVQTAVGAPVLTVDTQTGAGVVNVGAFNAAYTSFPTTPVLDNFNRSSTGPPPSSNWSQGPFDFTAGHGLKVVSNTQLQAAQFGSFFRQDDYWNVSNFGPDSEVYATIATKGASDQIGLYIRGTSIGSGTSNGYYLNISEAGGASNWAIQSLTAGATNNLNSYTQAVASGDSVGFSARGSTIIAWYKAAAGSWVQVGAVNDSTYSAAGKIGVGIAGTNSATILDNFGGGTTGSGFSVDATGRVISKVLADSTTAVQIQNASGTNLFNVDTVNSNIALTAGTIFTAGAYSNGSTSTITQAVVDNNTTISATATAASLTFTVPSPTVTTAGRILYVNNAGGTNAFTLSLGSTSFVLNTGSTATLLWSGSAWTSAGVDGGTLQNGYNNSAGGTTPELLLDTTRRGLDIQDANTTLGSGETLFTVRASATATTLGNSIFNILANGKVGINIGSTSTTPTISNDLSFGQIAGATTARTIGVEAQTTSNIGGNGLTAQAGTGNGTGAGGTLQLQGGTSGSGAAATGGTVTVQGGTANGSGVSNGGNVNLTGGTAAGTGTKGLIVLSGGTVLANGTYSSGSTSTITQSVVDSNTTILATATAAGLTFTVPAPTVTTAGRLLYVDNAGGTNAFILNIGSSSFQLNTGSTATLLYSGSGWTSAGVDASALQNAYNNSGGGTTPEIKLDSTRSTLNIQDADSTIGTDLLDVSASNASGIGTVLFGVGNTGSTRVRTTTNSATGFQVQNASGANMLTIDTTATNVAQNDGCEAGSPCTNWTTMSGGTLATDSTAGEFESGAAGVKYTTSATNPNGVQNTLSAQLSVSTTYIVSFSMRLGTGTYAVGTSTGLDVRYNRTAATQDALCSTGSATSTSTFNLSQVDTTWRKVTCSFITSATSAGSGANLVIEQKDTTSGRIFLIDNLNIVAQNTTGTQNVSQIKIGGVTGEGLTLLTLDTFAAAPFDNTTVNSAFYGSIYFDTTAGSLQCYGTSGWGACGAAPSVSVNLVPEYAGLVLHGTGVGTLTSDFCANASSGNFATGGTPGPINSGICSTTGDIYNYYAWTSPQSTAQAYSLYVKYQLPATFKNFASSSTITLTARTTSTTDGSVAYTMYKPDGTLCGTSTTVTSSNNTWQTVSLGGDETTCSLNPNDIVLFKVDVSAKNSAYAYVSNLSFTTLGK